jgi:hypothetical protein
MSDSTQHIVENKQRLVTVVIPLYTLRLSEIELVSLKQCFQVLGSHDIAIVKPYSLDISPLKQLIEGNATFRVEEFDNHYFAGREGYNRLMLSTTLYERFLDSKYILIHQTDVYVFKDELEQWCQRGYDYIGAPWLPAVGDVSGWNLPKRAFYMARRALGKFKSQYQAINLKYLVGNGGCSLRHTKHFLDAATKLSDAFALAASDSSNHENFEDVVWSVRVNRLCPGTLSIAPCHEAVFFSMESHPTMAMRLTGGQLPMATHAFARRRNRSFWKQYIKDLQ